MARTLSASEIETRSCRGRELSESKLQVDLFVSRLELMMNKMDQFASDGANNSAWGFSNTLLKYFLWALFTANALFLFITWAITSSSCY